MRKKCSSALHKVLPVILCVLLFVCTIPLIAFADDLGFESGGGSSRGGGVGRIHDGLSADISAAPRSGDLICNSCGAEYSSDKTLPLDFKCPSCGDEFFSVNKVMLTCWRCKQTTIFYIDDITGTSVCSHCGAYISALVRQGDKTGYAFKAGGGSTRGGGVSRHHPDIGYKPTVVLSPPSPEVEKTIIEYPSDMKDLTTWNKGHGMIRMNHGFSFAYKSYANTDGSSSLCVYPVESCKHLSVNSFLMDSYAKTLLYKDVLWDGSVYDDCSKFIKPSYGCNDDFIGATTLGKAHSSISTLFYCVAPESGYYWVSHYPYGQMSIYEGYENGKISKDKNGNFYYSNMWWVRKGTSPKFALFAQPHVFSGTTDAAYACSGGDSIGYAYCLSSESNKIKIGNPSYYSQTPLYFNKGDYIFFTAWIFDGTYKGDALGFGGDKNERISKLDYPYVSYVPANLGREGDLVVYDWQYDDDDDTYILITYPDPLDWKSYSTTIDYEAPEIAPSDKECCDHTGIIAVLEEIRDKLVSGFADINKKLEDLQKPTPTPTPSPSPAPAPTWTPGGGATRGGGVGRHPSDTDAADWTLHYYILNNRRYDAYYALKKTEVNTETKLPWVDNKKYISTTQIFIANGQYTVSVPDGVYWRVWQWDEASQTLTGVNSSNWHSTINNFLFNATGEYIFEFCKADGSDFNTAKDVTLKLKNDKITEYEPGGALDTEPVTPETQNLIIPKMNSNTFADEHGTWIASGSSKYSDVFDFFYAFDRSTANFWETNVSPSHLQIEIPDPENYYIDGYIMRISKFTNRYAKEWTLQGSDDGKTWDDLDTQNGQNLSDLKEHKYPLTLRKAYKYYRLNMSNYASSMCSLSHFNLLGYDAKDVVTPTPAPTDPPSPSPAPDPGTDPTPVPTPGGGTVPAPGGDSNISGGDGEGLFGWIWDLLKDIVKSILKAIFKIIANILGFLIWIVERVGLLLPFLPGPAVAALGAGVVLVFVIRIIRFIRG